MRVACALLVYYLFFTEQLVVKNNKPKQNRHAKPSSACKFVAALSIYHHMLMETVSFFQMPMAKKHANFSEKLKPKKISNLTKLN